jgi:hypothetical protein
MVDSPGLFANEGTKLTHVPLMLANSKAMMMSPKLAGMVISIER